MAKTNINQFDHIKKIANSAIEFVQWPSSFSSTKAVMAVQTTRFPFLIKQQQQQQHLNYSKTANSPYQAFNLGLHVGDNVEVVKSNRHSLKKLLPKGTLIQWLEQVHGDHVAEITQVSKQAIIADAAITRQRNLCLAIMTADCLPILLTSKQGDEIAAIHGGWRSLAANIINNTLNKMNTSPVELYAWLGPCIGPTAFEVGHEVKEVFVKMNDSFRYAFVEQASGKYLADLQKIARLQLQLIGVINISSLSDCTFSNTSKYYSYRKNSTTGRMASLICLL